MASSIEKKIMASAMVLSVLLPMSLLAAFRLTGILREPGIKIAETTTLNTVKWELEKPGDTININEKLQSLYEEDAVIRQSLLVDDYHNGAYGYGGSSYMALTVNITASAENGFVQDIGLVLVDEDRNARINFSEEHQSMKLDGLSQTALKDWTSEVFVNLTNLSRSDEVYFWAPIDWVLGSENKTHQLQGISETVYFNGTAYKKVVQAFQLKLFYDDNDSFETAQEIHAGDPQLFLIGGSEDIKDFYKVTVTAGLRIRIVADGTIWDALGRGVASPDFNLYLYDPDRNLVASNTSRDYVKSIDAVAGSTGFWFVEVRNLNNFGFYSLEVAP